MLTQKTALDVWCAYDEIAKGEKLLADMEKAIKEGTDPNPRDLFGRRNNLQLGVPSGDNGHRLLDVNPKLAMSVIRAHIADKRAELVKANERALLEFEASEPAAP